MPALRTLPARFASDAELARALAVGDPFAPAAAWDRFANVARSVFWRALGPATDVDDLLQELFMTLFRRARDIREPNSIGSFVVGIALRLTRVELRRRRQRRNISLTDTGSVPDVRVPHDDFDGRAVVRRLYAILDELGTEERLAFVLHNIEGLDNPAVARALGCSLATAKRRIVKANERVLFRAKRDPELAGRLARTTNPSEIVETNLADERWAS
jgi:RNA polymerase sigma-70 factor (ECF subfamily)